jgi:hypothetical protein
LIGPPNWLTTQPSVSQLRLSLGYPRTTNLQVYDIKPLLLLPPYKASSTTTTAANLQTSSFSYFQSRSTTPYATTVTATEEIPTTILYLQIQRQSPKYLSHHHRSLRQRLYTGSSSWQTRICARTTCYYFSACTGHIPVASTKTRVC